MFRPYLCLCHSRFRNGIELAVLVPKVREEVELEGFGEAGCGGEGDVDVAVQNLNHIRARRVHALRQFCLRNAQLLHALKDTALGLNFGEAGEGEVRRKNEEVRSAEVLDFCMNEKGKIEFSNSILLPSYFLLLTSYF